MVEIPDPRAAAVDWAARALAYELNEPPPLCEARAESLVAIAEHCGVADEVLIAWIHQRAEAKEWSAAEWRAWCGEYVSAKEESEESWEASRALSEMRESGL